MPAAIAKKGRQRSLRSLTRARRFRVLWLVGLVAISVYLYYRPLASYFETKHELAASRTEVAVLRVTKEHLEQRLAFSASVEATRREARRLGFVRPGEQLFIVKGIPAWRHAHARSVRGNG